MSDLSKKTLIPSGDTKNYIENYWTKRADAFLPHCAVRSCTVKKYSQWQREIVQHLPPQNSCVSLTLAAAPVFSPFCWLMKVTESPVSI